MDKIDILNKFRFYHEAASSSQSEFERAASVVSLPIGAFVFHEGDVCRQIALIGDGRIRVFKVSEKGREINLYHVQARETCILSASCLLAGVGYPATAQVELPTQALVFPGEFFRDWVNTKDEVRHFVFETVATRMASMMTLIEEVAFGKMDYRLAEFLVHNFANEGRPTTVLYRTHEQIAAELGSAREVMSRLLKEFERVGAIELARGRLHLRNENILRKLYDLHSSQRN